MIKILLLIFLLLAGSAEAANLYVNNSGSPACSDSTPYASNSSSSPWCTIGRAAWGNASRASASSAQAAKAGDTVYVTAGTYTMAGDNGGESWGITLNPVNSGSSGSPITFQAVGTVSLAYSSGVGSVIGASSLGGPGTGSKNYIIWDGFTLNDDNLNHCGSGAGPDCSYGLARVSSNNVIIRNCIISGKTGTHNFGDNYIGIMVQGATSAEIYNNKIYNILKFGTTYHHNSAGIMTYGTIGTTFRNNEIYNCGSGIFLKGRLDGVMTNEDNVIRNNLIYSPGSMAGKGIMLSTVAGTYTKVYQNIVRNLESGISVHGLVSDGVAGSIYIVNNTVYRSGSDDENGAVVIKWEGVASKTVYTKNNIYSQNNYPGINGAYWDNIYPADNLKDDRNIYYNVNRYYLAGGYDTSITNWRTRLGGGCPGADDNSCNSITSDPLFTNAGSNDFTLQAGSPALTLGRTITAIHGSSGSTIPAGAYITGNEVIGIDSNGGSPAPAPPGLRGVTISGGSIR